MTTLAYSHTLVAGTPENINDVQDMFNDARTVINGNLDATNFAATAKPATLMGRYQPVSEAAFSFTSSQTAATYLTTASGGALAVAAASAPTVLVFPLTLADYAVSGLTTQFRIQASTITNTIAPAINFTYMIAQVLTTGGSAGQISIATVNTHGPSAVTRAAPAASSLFTDASSDFTLTTSSVYVLVVTTSGTPAANSMTQCTLRLQVHNT